MDFIYPFFFSLIEVILLLSLSEKAYLNASTMVSNFQFILMIICVLMILFNNGIGLHDLVSQTEVIFDELEEDESGNMSKWKEKQMIEKACDAYCKVCGHFPHTVPTHICRHNCEYFSDFKRYMEDK